MADLEELAGPFMTEGYAVLRDARRENIRNPESWPRISPDEAKAITADLHRANQLADAVRELTRSRTQGNPNG